MSLILYKHVDLNSTYNKIDLDSVLGNIFLEANMQSVPRIQVSYVWEFF